VHEKKRALPSLDLHLTEDLRLAAVEAGGFKWLSLL